MERDFLGLNSKDSVTIVEEEIKDGSKDHVFKRGSGMQWPFSNKVSALPQFMPFKNVQEERSKKTAFDPLTSSGFMPTSTADAFDTHHKSFTGVVQKNLVLDKQGGTHYTMAAYPLQHGDTHSAHRSHDIRAFSASNHMISVAMGNPFFKTHSQTTTHNFGAASMKQQQPLGGIPIMANPTHSFVPNGGSMVGSADQRNISKQAGAPAQLTIFYGGSVNVYDDVSPEKAQAIMFLAGNGSSVNPSLNPRAQVMAPTPKPVVGDGVHGNQSHSTSPCSGLSSPMSVTSHAAAQSGCGSGGTDEVMVAKTMGALTAPSSLPEPTKSFTTLGSATTTLMPAAVPQARKASLARFLEKRKERVMSTVPYNTGKKSLDGSTSPGSQGWPFSNKVSALPQFMPFKNVQEERSKRIAFDPLTSSGFMPISTADAFDTHHKSFTGAVQKILVLDKQGGTHYTMTAYPLQHGDTHSAHRSHNIRAFSASDHMISVAMDNPFFKAHSPTTTHNFGAASMKQQQPLGGIPIMANPAHSFIPNGGSMVGSADQRNISKEAGAPVQLTIFYGGLVIVYEDVSPKKAQTIMFLAGNGSVVNPSLNPRAQVVAPTPKPVVGDGVHGNQPCLTSPCSGLPSPMSVAPHAAAQSGCGSGGTDEVMVVKTMGVLIVPSSLLEPLKSFKTLGSAATALMPAALPVS